MPQHRLPRRTDGAGSHHGGRAPARGEALRCHRNARNANAFMIAFRLADGRWLELEQLRLLPTFEYAKITTDPRSQLTERIPEFIRDPFRGHQVPHVIHWPDTPNFPT